MRSNTMWLDIEYCSHGLIDPAYKIVHMEADAKTYETMKKAVEEMQKIAKDRKCAIITASYPKRRNHGTVC